MSLSTPHPLSLSPYEGEREETLERGLRKRNTEGESKRGVASLI